MLTNMFSSAHETPLIVLLMQIKLKTVLSTVRSRVFSTKYFARKLALTTVKIISYIFQRGAGQINIRLNEMQKECRIESMLSEVVPN